MSRTDRRQFPAVRDQREMHRDELERIAIGVLDLIDIPAERLGELPRLRARLFPDALNRSNGLFRQGVGERQHGARDLRLAENGDDPGGNPVPLRKTSGSGALEHPHRLSAAHVRLPIRTDGRGKTSGGGLISRGHLYKILSNPIYLGRLSHKDQVHEGLHNSIVDHETWDRVQCLLAEHAQVRAGSRQDSDALLAGKLFDDRGNRMSPSHATKGGRRYRYYVSQAILQGRKEDVGSVARVPAMEIERRVVEAVRGAAPSDHLERSIGRRSIQRVSRHPGADVAAIGIDATASASSSCAFDLDLRAAVGRVTIRRTTLEIQFAEGMTGDAPDRVLVIPWTPPSPYRRREIIQGEGEQPAAVRPMRTKARAILIDALRDAHRWLDELTTNSNHTIASISAREKKTERSIRMTMSLAFLSPALVKAAIDGRLPRGFGIKRLMDLPMAWSDQWSALGLKAPAQA